MLRADPAGGPAVTASQRAVDLARVAAHYQAGSLTDALLAFGPDVERALRDPSRASLRRRLPSVGAWLFAALSRDVGGEPAALEMVRALVRSERARPGAPDSAYRWAEAAAGTAEAHPSGVPAQVAALGVALDALGRGSGWPEGGQER